MDGEPETARTERDREAPPLGNRVLLAAFVVFLCTTPFGEIRFFPDSEWFTPTKVGFLVLAGAAGAAFLAGYRPRFSAGVAALLAAFLGAALLSAGLSSSPAGSLVYALRMVALAALCLCTAWVATAPASPRPVLLALLAVAVPMGALGIYQTLTGRTLGTLGVYTDLGRMQEIFRETADGGITVVRATGAFDHPNLLACFLIASLPYALVLVARTPIRRISFFASAAAVLVCVAALVLTFSRGAFLGFVAAVGVLTVRRLVNVKNLAVIVLAIAAAVWALPAPARPLLRNREYAAQDAGTGRVFSFRLAARMIRAHPFRGVGPGLFHHDSPQYRQAGEAFRFNPRHKLDAHNTYLDLAAEMGLPALALFLGIMAAAALALRKVAFGVGPAPPNPAFTADMAAAIAAGLAALLTQSLLHSLEYQEVFWVLLGLAFAAVCRIRRQPQVPRVEAR